MYDEKPNLLILKLAQLIQVSLGHNYWSGENHSLRKKSLHTVNQGTDFFVSKNLITQPLIASICWCAPRWYPKINIQYHKKEAEHFKHDQKEQSNNLKETKTKTVIMKLILLAFGLASGTFVLTKFITS